MQGTMLAFLIWVALGTVFVGYGICICFSKKQKPFGFWANVEQFQVNDVKGYNHALGKLFMVFGIVFVLLGIPMQQGQNSGGIIISILGTMFLVILIMGIYTTVIEKKYKVKK